MNKLNIIVVSEKIVTQNMGGCGRNMPQLCGSKDCSFNGTSRDN